jgi:hypothetical protein
MGKPVEQGKCVPEGTPEPPHILAKTDLDISIGSPPHQRKPRQPILAIDRLPCPSLFFAWQNPRRRGEFRTSDFSSNRAQRNSYLRVIPNPLRLPHVTARHHIELAVFFSKPHRSCDTHSGFAKRCQGNIILTLNGRRNLAWHKPIIEWPQKPLAAAVSNFGPLSSLVRNHSRRLLPSRKLCYKPEHA